MHNKTVCGSQAAVPDLQLLQSSASGCHRNPLHDDDDVTVTYKGLIAPGSLICLCVKIDMNMIFNTE